MPNTKESSPSLKPNVGRAYELMELSFKVAMGVNAIPFTYDTARRRLAVDTRSLKFIIWFIIMFLGILIELSQITKELIRGAADDSMSRSDWCLLCLLRISWWFLTTCHYQVLIKHQEMVDHLNQTLWAREWFSEERLPKTKDHKLVHIHLWFGNLQALGQCFLVAAEGTKSHYIYSNVPEEYRSTVTASIWAAYAFYRVMSNSLAGYFQYFASTLHINSCNQILGLRKEEKMTFEEKAKTYRILQIIANRFNDAYSMFTVHITIFATENLIVGIYGAIKFVGQMPVDKYINFPLMVIIITIFIFTYYQKNASIYEETYNEFPNTLSSVTKILERRRFLSGSNDGRNNATVRNPSGHRLQNRLELAKTTSTHANDRKRFTKEVLCTARSCFAVGVPFGSLYYIKQSTALNILNFICCNTISTLITYP